MNNKSHPKREHAARDATVYTEPTVGDQLPPVYSARNAGQIVFFLHL